jgi:2,3-bisphosphoglycerate-dependent phosphoglycerate mutase
MTERDAEAMYTDVRYADLPPEGRQRTESLADVRARMLPYWYDVLLPLVLDGGTPLVVGHGNSLRAFVMHLEGLVPAEVENLDIPTAVPMRYRVGADRRPVFESAGRYLDAAAAAEPIRIGRR